MIEDREELIFMLSEAAALEHMLSLLKNPPLDEFNHFFIHPPAHLVEAVDRKKHSGERAACWLVPQREA